jgi:hypothetical protein
MWFWRPSVTRARHALAIALNSIIVGVSLVVFVVAVRSHIAAPKQSVTFLVFSRAVLWLFDGVCICGRNIHMRKLLLALVSPCCALIVVLAQRPPLNATPEQLFEAGMNAFTGEAKDKSSCLERSEAHIGRRF